MCRASKDSGRAKIGARAKKEKEQGGGTSLVRERLLRRLHKHLRGSQRSRLVASVWCMTSLTITTHGLSQLSEAEESEYAY